MTTKDIVVADIEWLQEMTTIALDSIALLIKIRSRQTFSMDEIDQIIKSIPEHTNSSKPAENP